MILDVEQKKRLSLHSWKTQVGEKCTPPKYCE